MKGYILHNDEQGWTTNSRLVRKAIAWRLIDTDKREGGEV